MRVVIVLLLLCSVVNAADVLDSVGAAVVDADARATVANLMYARQVTTGGGTPLVKWFRHVTGRYRSGTTAFTIYGAVYTAADSSLVCTFGPTSVSASSVWASFTIPSTDSSKFISGSTAYWIALRTSVAISPGLRADLDAGSGSWRVDSTAGWSSWPAKFDVDVAYTTDMEAILVVGSEPPQFGISHAVHTTAYGGDSILVLDTVHFSGVAAENLDSAIIQLDTRTTPLPFTGWSPDDSLLVDTTLTLGQNLVISHKFHGYGENDYVAGRVFVYADTIDTIPNPDTTCLAMDTSDVFWLWTPFVDTGTVVAQSGLLYGQSYNGTLIEADPQSQYSDVAVIQVRDDADSIRRSLVWFDSCELRIGDTWSVGYATLDLYPIGSMSSTWQDSILVYVRKVDQTLTRNVDTSNGAPSWVNRVSNGVTATAWTDSGCGWPRSSFMEPASEGVWVDTDTGAWYSFDVTDIVREYAGDKKASWAFLIHTPEAGTGGYETIRDFYGPLVEDFPALRPKLTIFVSKPHLAGLPVRHGVRDVAKMNLSTRYNSGDND